MENEESRRLIDKKASEDQLKSLLLKFLLTLMALGLFSLSLIPLDTQISWNTLGGVWHTWDLEQEGKGEAGKCKRIARLVATTGFSCR